MYLEGLNRRQKKQVLKLMCECCQGNRPITIVNSSVYDLLPSDNILHVVYTTTGAVTSLTLPTSQLESGRLITVKDGGGNSSANTITVDTEGSETIDGSGSLLINSDYASVTIYSDGVNWFTI